MIIKTLPLGPQDDPIFAAIEAHRAARQELHRELKIQGVTEEQLNPFCEKVDCAMERLISTRPKTIEGTLAFLRHWRNYEIDVGSAEHGDADERWKIIDWTERALTDLVGVPSMAAV
jgi:hypothetical protein